MDFLWTPTVSDHVLRHFNDLGVCVINPRDAARIEPHMCGLNCCRFCHTPGNYRAPPTQTRPHLIENLTITWPMVNETFLKRTHRDPDTKISQLIP